MNKALLIILILVVLIFLSMMMFIIYEDSKIEKICRDNGGRVSNSGDCFIEGRFCRVECFDIFCNDNLIVCNGGIP